MGPKVYGAWNIAQAVRMEELDFMVFFSSIVGLLGNPGQADYAGAQCVSWMRLPLADQIKHISFPSTGPFGKKGAWGWLTALLRVFRNRTGMVPLETAAGVSAFCSLLARDFRKDAPVAVWHGEPEENGAIYGVEGTGKQDACPRNPFGYRAENKG